MSVSHAVKLKAAIVYLPGIKLLFTDHELTNKNKRRRKGKMYVISNQCYESEQWNDWIEFHYYECACQMKNILQKSRAG